MTYQIVLKKSAQKHIAAHKRSGNAVLCRKIEDLLLELAEHPREGTGKHESVRSEVYRLVLSSQGQELVENVGYVPTRSNNFQ